MLIESPTFSDWDRMREEEDVVMLYIGAPECGVCIDDFPRIQNIAKDIPLVKGNVEKDKILAAQNLVFTVPTVLIFKQGVEEFRQSRFLDFEEIQAALATIMEA